MEETSFAGPYKESQDLFESVFLTEGSSLGDQNLYAGGPSLWSSIRGHGRDIPEDFDLFDPQGPAYGVAGVSTDQKESVDSI